MLTGPLREGASCALPVILIVEDDRDALSAAEHALIRRFGGDYTVLTATSAELGDEIIDALAADGRPLAFIGAALRLPGMSGPELLDRAHDLHPGARRALLIGMGDAAAIQPVQLASARGQVDMWILHGWESPEEWLYPQVQQALSAWALDYRPRHEHIRIVGEQWSPRSHELRDLLTRNVVPFGFYDAASADGQRLLEQHGHQDSPLPVMILFDGQCVIQPTRAQLAQSLGVRTQPDPGTYDVVILGAGPAGLAAAVYAASEGLRTVVIEPSAVGGQAGSSAMIRNYPGFPRGIVGSRLTNQMFEQASLLGAQFAFSYGAAGILQRGDDRVVVLNNGTEVVTRTVIIATGVSYRRLDIAALDRLIGMGVFYGAASSEAAAMAGQRVAVVGGANSAGQAALQLARFASHVTILVRGSSLEAGMSDYLVQEIRATPNIDVRLQTRVVDGSGTYHLQSLRLEHVETGMREDLTVAGAFIMIGARPHTDWLESLERDPEGYIRTGSDVSPSAWEPSRNPTLHETSMPGVFAIGDVRSGAVKRVVSAVGDGGVGIGQVHRYLAETAAPSFPPTASMAQRADR